MAGDDQLKEQLTGLIEATFGVSVEGVEVEEFEWEPNLADLDIVLTRCTECGMESDLPRDATPYLNSENMFCGCGASQCFEIIADPSPNRDDAKIAELLAKEAK